MTPEARELLRGFAARASVEVTPRDAEKAGALLPPGSHVFITALPGADSSDLVDAAIRLREAGQVPVPHIAARGIPGPVELDRLLGRLVAEAGVDDVLVVAGSVRSQAGAYASSMDVLTSGLLEQHGIRRAAVAGHPEGSPDISDVAAADAIEWKNGFAERSELELRIVTQFALAAQPYLDWEAGIRAAGNRLPVTAGLPGVTSPPQLIKFGLRCGIGPSLEILRKQTGGLVRLATSRMWRPDQLAEEIAAAQVADPARLFAGIHLFPFGGVEKTAAWLSEMRNLETALPA